MEKKEQMSPFELAEEWYNSDSGKKRTITALVKRLVATEEWTVSDERQFLIRKDELINPTKKSKTTSSKIKNTSSKKVERKQNSKDRDAVNHYLLEKCNKCMFFKDNGEILNEWCNPSLDKETLLQNKDEVYNLWGLKKFNSSFWVKLTKMIAVSNFFPNQKIDAEAWIQIFSWKLVLKTFQSNEEDFEKMLNKDFVDQNHLENSILYFLSKHIKFVFLRLMKEKRLKQIAEEKEKKAREYNQKNETNQILTFERKKRKTDENSETQAEKEERMRQKLKELM